MPNEPRPLGTAFPWVLSFAIHGGLAMAIYLLPAQAQLPKARPPIEVIDRQLPEKELPAAEPEPPPPPPPAPTPTRVAMAQKPPKQRPPENAPPPPPEKAPTDEKAPEDTAPQTFGIQMSGTVQAAPGQGVQVPAGDSLTVSPRITKRGPARPAKPTDKKGFKTEYAPYEEAPIAVLTTRPQMKKKVVPEYPDQIKELGLEGRVYVEVTVGVSGKVLGVKLLKGLHPVLDQVALKAARQLEFAPATVNGKPVKTKIPVPFLFQLD